MILAIQRALSQLTVRTAWQANRRASHADSGPDSADSLRSAPARAADDAMKPSAGNSSCHMHPWRAAKLDNHHEPGSRRICGAPEWAHLADRRSKNPALDRWGWGAQLRVAVDKQRSELEVPEPLQALAQQASRVTELVVLKEEVVAVAEVVAVVVWACVSFAATNHQRIRASHK